MTVTCPASTSSCPGFLRICLMRPSSFKPTSSSTVSPTVSSPSRRPFSGTRGEQRVGAAWERWAWALHPGKEPLPTICFHSPPSIAIGAFPEFQQAASCQRPDAILRQQQHLAPSKAPIDPLLPVAEPNSLVKVAVWGLTATLGAAALAVTQTALEWAPEFLLQLF